MAFGSFANRRYRGRGARPGDCGRCPVRGNFTESGKISVVWLPISVNLGGLPCRGGLADRRPGWRQGRRPGRRWPWRGRPGAGRGQEGELRCQAERGPGGRDGRGDSARLAGRQGPGGERQRIGQGAITGLWRRMAPFAKTEDVKAMRRVPGWIPIRPPGDHARARRRAWDSFRWSASTGAHDDRLRGGQCLALVCRPAAPRKRRGPCHTKSISTKIDPFFGVRPRRRRRAAGFAPKIDSEKRQNRY